MSTHPYRRVIVGTDGSSTATEAVRRAARYAGALGIPLLVACVYGRTRPGDLGPPSERAKMPGEAWMSVDYRAATDIAKAAATEALRVAPDLEVDTATPEGNPAEELLALVEGVPGTLLAVGSQGMDTSARFLLGGVPHKVSHHAVGDLLIVRTGEGRPDRLPERVVVGYDGSARARQALEVCLALAAASGAQVTVVSITDDEAAGHERVDEARALAEDAVVVEGFVRDGDPAGGILDASEEADLVVVGNRGMTGPSRFLMGSVPNKVSHHIERDLLIVKTSDEGR